MSHQALTVFDFETSPVRVVDRKGNPWFVLADVCRALSVVNVGDAAARLDTDERGHIGNPDATAAGGNPNVIVINESGLYSLILTSRKDSAKRFKKWVTGTVLPSIRKHGGYVKGQEGLTTGDVTQAEYLAKAVLMAQSVLAEAHAKIAVMEPKALFHDEFADAGDLFSLRDAAKTLGVKPKEFTKRLQSAGYLCANKMPAQRYREQGLFDVRLFQPPFGAPSAQTRVTSKGLARLGSVLARQRVQMAA